MKICTALLLFPVMAFAAATPQKLRSEIQKYGEAEFSEKISSDDWKTALDNISSGQNEWISLAPDLAPVINQQQAEQLSEALYYAIAPNAKEALNTLAILDKHKYKHQQGSVLSCVSPLNQPQEEMMRIYNETRLALLDVPGVESATCLWSLEGWMEQVKQEDASKTNK
ncbi:hypothetical protein GE278_18425 [Enterobacteriaceae bacterium Kacie_13]|nr:hypothetical protein GE278_18425 [Enterobacteriaceae bacterium Kacie_13]